MKLLFATLIAFISISSANASCKQFNELIDTMSEIKTDNNGIPEEYNRVTVESFSHFSTIKGYIKGYARGFASATDNESERFLALLASADDSLSDEVLAFTVLSCLEDEEANMTTVISDALDIAFKGE
ncbi:hypothetical protein [Spongorhabdus nitratireducens]